MNNDRLRNAFTWAATLGAAGLFAASLWFPLWHLKMEAPQYQGSEALRVRVYPGALGGDLKEIKVLNQYIGVHIPERLPELRWIPVALLAASLSGVLALALGRTARARLLFATATLLSLVLVASAAKAQWQMHDIGHQRDPHAILKGVPDFTPPILGRVKVANFLITTGLGAGALLIAAGLLLQTGAGLASGGSRSVACRDTHGASAELRTESEPVVST